MDIDYKKLLKEHCLSVTPVRLSVLEVLQKHPHADVAHIFEVVQKKISTTSKQAVYNNLNTLVEKKLIREIKPKGQPSLYETNAHDNHHHLICKQCHCIVDVMRQAFTSSPLLTDHHGFVVDETEIIFWGLCPNCQIPQL